MTIESIEKVFKRLMKSKYSLPKKDKDVLNIIISQSEHNKGVLTVVITSLYKKIITPSQDVRYHQSSLYNGYSGRGLDTHEITPFLKKQNFPAMAESGWLTRSLEQNFPYNKEYLGKITPAKLKCAFLEVFNQVEELSQNPEPYLCYIFHELVKQRNHSKKLQIARPQITQIKPLIERLEKQFNYSYNTTGAARLPVLCIYALYAIMINEFDKFSGMKLLPLQHHTVADSKKGAIGDIEVVNKNGEIFEALEIKHKKKITEQMLEDSYTKFKSSHVSWYYILTTSEEIDDLSSKIDEIKNNHGCQVIVNGVVHTIKYYLRNISHLSTFVDNYAKLLQTDTTVKYEHKKVWNELG